MTKIVFTIFLMVSIVFSSFSTHANILTGAVKGGALGFIIAHSVRVGGPVVLRAAGKKIAAHVAKNPGEAAAIVGAIVTLAVENQEWRQNAIKLIDYANLSPWLETVGISKTTIEEDGADFDQAYSFAVTHVANPIDYSNACARAGLPSEIAFNAGYRTFLSTMPSGNVSRHVELGDVGSYFVLKKSEEKNDDMEHDHVPSSAALKEFFRRKMKISGEDQLNMIHENATAVEIPADLHHNGRTYAGRNRKKENAHGNMIRIKLDAENLLKATIKDMSWHFINSNFDTALIKPFQNVLLRNAALCLYKGDLL